LGLDKYVRRSKRASRNDYLGLFVPYQYLGVDHSYEPNYVVRLALALTLILEIKGCENDEIKAKHDAIGVRQNRSCRGFGWRLVLHGVVQIHRFAKRVGFTQNCGKI